MGMLTDECRAASLRPWEPEKGRRAGRTVRLFRDFVPERLIFRGHPALPFAMVPPAIGFWLDRYAASPIHGAVTSVGVFALGALAWGLLEYLMHRFLFHFPARGVFGRALTFVVHGHHHVTPNERSRLAATPMQFGSLGLLMAGLWRLVFGDATWMLAMAGTMSGYLAYEAVHHIAHHGRPRSRVLCAIQRHHLAHHYGTAEARWGISTPLFDWLLRTHR